ncbi:MAG: hypothetical protein MRY83_15450 [Flavobacteriales bacterium]|nr:hypothetical protein [Flavobacteriales bacterium]
MKPFLLLILLVLLSGGVKPSELLISNKDVNDSLNASFDTAIHQSDFKKAYDLLQRIHEIEDLNSEHARNKEVEVLKDRFRLEEEEDMIQYGKTLMTTLKNELLNEKLSQGRLLLWVLIVTLLLVLFGMVFLSYFRRNQLSRNRYKLMLKSLRNRWKLKSAEVTQLEEIIQVQPDKGSLSKELIISFKEDKNWLLLVNQFDILFPTFRKTLVRAINGISESEIKLCYLIKLGLNNKEISDTLFITIESVKINKNRLRKKVDIETVSGLTQFINNIR